MSRLIILLIFFGCTTNLDPDVITANRSKDGIFYYHKDFPIHPIDPGCYQPFDGEMTCQIMVYGIESNDPDINFSGMIFNSIGNAYGVFSIHPDKLQDLARKDYLSKAHDIKITDEFRNFVRQLFRME